jgi:hypothetical protein
MAINDFNKETTMGGKTLNEEDKANYIKNFHGLVKRLFINFLHIV